jgi:hypothetical protein
MYERGATLEQVAARFGVAGAVTGKILCSEGVILRSRGRPGLRTDADTERALASAFLNGATIAECAARHPGVSYGQARDVLRELGVIP